MIYQVGDRGIYFDSGDNNPGDVLQRKEPDGWVEINLNGSPVRAPIDVQKLPPGEYRLVRRVE